jgi:hypothetical protein
LLSTGQYVSKTLQSNPFPLLNHGLFRYAFAVTGNESEKDEKKEVSA